MGTLSASVRGAGQGGRTYSRSSLLAVGALAVLFVAVVAASRVSHTAFYAAGLAFLATIGYVSYRAPRTMLLVVVIAPVLDRYLVGLFIPLDLRGATNYASEAMLLMVTASIGIRGLRDGSLFAALRHPVVYALAAFAVLAGISAALNGVPPLVAVAGILFTLDAATLFVLPRVIGFSTRDALIAAIGLTSVATIAAVLALGQVLLDPGFLGLESITGRFNEGNRIAAFLVNPNMLGVVLAIGTPFPLIATVRAEDRRVRWAAGIVTFLIVLALFYTFSRGAWLGLALAMITVGLVLERRALVALLLFGALAYGSAIVLPRHILDPDADTGFDIGGATFGRLDSFGSGNDLRLLFVENATPIILDHPVIGVGPGRYGGSVAARLGSPLYDQYTEGRVPRDRTVDNFWLHLLVESGVVGVLVFGSALLLALRELLGAARRMSGWSRTLLATAAAVGVIVTVDSVVEMLLEGNTTSFAMWFFVGVGSTLAWNASRSKPSAPMEGEAV